MKYAVRGFRSAEVDTIITRTREGQVTVTLAVVEHEPTLVRKIRIDYDSTLLRSHVKPLKGLLIRLSVDAELLV